MAKTPSTKTGPSDDKKLLYILAYLLTWITGLILYITEGQKDKRMKFHSLQAIFLGIIIFIIGWLPIPFIFILSLLGWIYGMYIGVKAYGNVDISIPVLGDYAKKYSS